MFMDISCPWIDLTLVEPTVCFHNFLWQQAEKFTAYYVKKKIIKKYLLSFLNQPHTTFNASSSILGFGEDLRLP